MRDKQRKDKATKKRRQQKQRTQSESTHATTEKSVRRSMDGQIGDLPVVDFKNDFAAIQDPLKEDVYLLG